MLTLGVAANQLLFSTARITAYLAGGDQSVGTAFFYHHMVDDQHTHTLPVLVTNKHVVRGGVTGEFLVHEAVRDASGNRVPGTKSHVIRLDQFEQRWIGHPGNVDLCAMPINPLVIEAKSKGIDVFYIALDDPLIPSEAVLRDLAAVEDIVMIGYPIGLWDRANNLPLIRRGITASHPSVDFNGHPEGVVDVASFPGSSGSPVLIFNQGSYATPRGLTVGSRALFLGALHAGPQFDAQGNIQIVGIPTTRQPVVSTPIPLHLGYYIKAREIVALVRHASAVLPP